MEETFNKYKKVILEAKDFRDLDERDRKILIQRFIDQILYDVKKFKVAVRVLEKWEKDV